MWQRTSPIGWGSVEKSGTNFIFSSLEHYSPNLSIAVRFREWTWLMRSWQQLGQMGCRQLQRDRNHPRDPHGMNFTVLAPFSTTTRILSLAKTILSNSFPSALSWTWPSTQSLSTAASNSAVKPLSGMGMTATNRNRPSSSTTPRRFGPCSQMVVINITGNRIALAEKWCLPL